MDWHIGQAGLQPEDRQCSGLSGRPSWTRPGGLGSKAVGWVAKELSGSGRPGSEVRCTRKAGLQTGSEAAGNVHRTLAGLGLGDQAWALGPSGQWQSCVLGRAGLAAKQQPGMQGYGPVSKPMGLVSQEVGWTRGQGVERLGTRGPADLGRCQTGARPGGSWGPRHW